MTRVDVHTHKNVFYGAFPLVELLQTWKLTLHLKQELLVKT